MITPLALVLLLMAPLQRTTTLGPVLGAHDRATGTDFWLGIPYAAAPVGDRRWQPPVAPVPWTRVRETQAFGQACAQLGGLQGPGLHQGPFGPGVADAFGQPVGSEDCLTLNIWRPAQAASGLPVIVFLHGGANVAGYTADPLYHGARLAAGTEAVVVTMNYRLGVFGWFDNPWFAGAGNLGLRDIVLGLQFVRANAAAFGGDSANLTVVGQSAGAVNTLAIMTSPGGRGLFHRAVALSGALVAVPSRAQHAYAQSVAQHLLVGTGTAKDSASASAILGERGGAWIAQRLRAASTADLVRAAAHAPGGGLPVADGFLPADLRAVVREGRHARMPLWLGRTSEEGKFFVAGVYRVSDADRWRAMLGGAPVHESEILDDAHVAPGAFEAAAARAAVPVNQLLDGTIALFRAAQGDAVLTTTFEWANQPAPWRRIIGAAHGGELPFLFGNFGPSLYSAGFTETNRSEREALSADWMRRLASFIRGPT